MKKIILIISLISLISCESNDNENQTINESNFKIEITANNSALIDEIVEVKITANDTLNSLMTSFDNFETGFTNFIDLGASTTRYFSFNLPEQQTTVYFKATDSNGNESIETYTPTIKVGNSLKIEAVKILSFLNIDGTWDSEFPESSEERLADVIFALSKPVLNRTEGYFMGTNYPWYFSEIKLNQGDLYWDLSNEDVYLNPELLVKFSLSDSDGGNLGEDLMLGPPTERDLDFSDYIEQKPESIIWTVPEIDLEVQFFLKWN
jgi:hypothetical protein